MSAKGSTRTLKPYRRDVVRAPLRVVAKESRIGKHPVPVPKGVTYTLKDNHLAVKVRAKTTV